MPKRPHIPLAQVQRLWLHRQGLAEPRGTTKFSKRALTDHLERTGALQIDSVNVLDRAHYLTLWSRFGPYDRQVLDRWIYRDRLAYEYWGHEASILPISHLSLGRRRMRRFPSPTWKNAAWWTRYNTSVGSKRRVLRRIREEGPLESTDFDKRTGEDPSSVISGWGSLKEDKRSLKLLWHTGRLAVTGRRHFRCVYDLAERVYPATDIATQVAAEDHWLHIALSGNGIASERHVRNYFTTPSLKAPDRKRIIARNLRKKQILEVEVEGQRGKFFARPEDLTVLAELPEPRGTHLLCPFDSLLWQRQRAEELLGFEYRIEIYTPPAKRKYGYYVLPVMHDGRLVGRLDPKMHRDRNELEIKAIYLEEGVERSRHLLLGLRDALEDLARFLAADKLTLPPGWRRLV